MLAHQCLSDGVGWRRQRPGRHASMASAENSNSSLARAHVLLLTESRRGESLICNVGIPRIAHLADATRHRHWHSCNHCHHMQAHPRRVAKVSAQIQRELSELFIYDTVSPRAWSHNAAKLFAAWLCAGCMWWATAATPTATFLPYPPPHTPAGAC